MATAEAKKQEMEVNIPESCLEISINGKISTIEEINTEKSKFYVNTIVIPAKDKFTKPTRLQVNSEMPLGREEDIVQILANVAPVWRLHGKNWYCNNSIWEKRPN